MNLPTKRDVLIQGCVLFGLMIASTGLARADVVENVQKAGTIKIGIFEDFPPFASLGSDMQVQGYDVDMANLIAKSLGVKAELVGINGQNRIPFLTEGKVDMLLSIGFSDERAQVVDFTKPYAPYYIAVMGPKEIEVKGPADLAGKTIAVNRGTLEDTEVTKVAPPTADIQRFTDYAGVISAFLSGQSQLMVVGNDVGATILAKNPKIEPVEKFLLLTSPSNMAVKWLKQPLAADF